VSSDVSEEALLEAFSRPHINIVAVLASRLAKIKVVKNLWQKGDVKVFPAARKRFDFRA
jgi:hypothetical protein